MVDVGPVFARFWRGNSGLAIMPRGTKVAGHVSVIGRGDSCFAVAKKSGRAVATNYRGIGSIKIAEFSGRATRTLRCTLELF
jgi:hypothetical protein